MVLTDAQWAALEPLVADQRAGSVRWRGGRAGGLKQKPQAQAAQRGGERHPAKILRARRLGDRGGFGQGIGELLAQLRHRARQRARRRVLGSEPRGDGMKEPGSLGGGGGRRAGAVLIRQRLIEEMSLEVVDVLAHKREALGNALLQVH